jgi:hypothetical protein
MRGIILFRIFGAFFRGRNYPALKKMGEGVKNSDPNFKPEKKHKNGKTEKRKILK